ncbi:MAG TPA: putative Ig domain-containing protein [Phycisphaerae bacterium]|nr:putative Ig domain-containing protein [Phycisphaerae bacterium]
MAEETMLAHRAKWILVFAAAAFVGAGLALSGTLLAGDPPESATVHEDLAEAGLQIGPGQPLEFYEQSFGRPDPDQGRVIACFAQGTDEQVVAYFHELLQVEAGERYQVSGRWSGAQGTPRALTWSFVPDGLSISNGVGEPVAPSELFSRMDSLFAAQGGRAAWINRFQQCFDRWAQLCGTSYTRITVGGNDWDDGAAWGSAGSAGLRGDIRISMKNIDGGSGILAYNFFPSSGDMVIDRSENWGSTTNQNRFFRNTVMHEHGHGLGIAHVCPVSGSKLMEPFLNTGFDGLRHDDVRAGQRHYGDIYESNDTAGTAAAIGTLAVGPTISIGALPPPPAGTSPASTSLLSIDANGKTDFFTFHVDSPLRTTVTVAPQGLTYPSGGQNFDGSCSAGTNVNSLSRADLGVEILATDGVTVLGTANATGAGSAETLSQVDLPAAGDYFVRVYENDNPTEVQLYTLNLSATAACPELIVDPSALADASIGQPFSQALSASGGTGPYTYAVTSGSLPAGLTLSAGTLSGTPTGPAGPSNFTITATDTATACTTNKSYSQFVVCPPVTLTPTSLPPGKLGRSYNKTLSAGGAIGPYSFGISAGGLPPGLSLSAEGVLSGVPHTQTGVFAFTVTATSESGCVGSRAYSITIGLKALEPI